MHKKDGNRVNKSVSVFCQNKEYIKISEDNRKLIKEVNDLREESENYLKNLLRLKNLI